MEVVGHQFYFEFRYPGFKQSLVSPKDEMVLPVGRPVRILLSSSDVIHQFWVPDFRLKLATVPGLVQDMNFTPLRTGTYDIVCSEYCGLLPQPHARQGRRRVAGRFRQVVFDAQIRVGRRGEHDRSRWRAAARRPDRRSSTRSARPATRSRRSTTRSSVRDSITSRATRRTRTSSTASRRRRRTSRTSSRTAIPGRSARCRTVRPTACRLQNIADLTAYLVSLK